MKESTIMSSKVFWLSRTEGWAWLHVWLPDDLGGTKQTEVFLDLKDLKTQSYKVQEGDTISFKLGYRNGKYIAEDPIWCGKND